MIWLSVLTVLRELAWEFGPIIIITPVAGYFFLLATEYLQGSIKSKNRRKKWLAYVYLFFIIAICMEWIIYTAEVSSTKLSTPHKVPRLSGLTSLR